MYFVKERLIWKWNKGKVMSNLYLLTFQGVMCYVYLRTCSYTMIYKGNSKT